MRQPHPQAVHTHRHRSAAIANAVPLWQRRTLDLTQALLFASGAGWLIVHYALGAGVDGQLPHPSEPWLMRLHGLFAFGALTVFGMFIALHVPRGWRGQQRRPSAIWVLASWGCCILSAYLLYYFVSETTHPLIGLLHAGCGMVLWAAVNIHRLVNLDESSRIKPGPHTTAKSETR